MAKKGQKFNKYTPEQRKEIVDKYFTGNPSYIFHYFSPFSVIIILTLLHEKRAKF